MAASKPPFTPAGGEETGQQVRSGHDADLEQRRRVLNEALAERDRRRSPAGSDRQNGAGSGIGAALKMSSEFVAGILVGAGLGYLLDQFAGTSPWGLIVFLMLGFAAGVLNVLRAAGVVAEPAAGVRAKRSGDDDTT
ncbi:AtpZ/AtpI family protein [Roseitalea porphyridii]|uniref:ATP synthase protein I n=1 Tax=Roseitalea porphyridii TaxID=1852022 RepID=A0A4P6V0R4_9HYPH|nr:AtpZ/AtpI family protein [Roseitalea porphyridii]QBK29930.1 ATP F0F1 synthase subunit I [Roseitalea porphyridii]